MAYKTEFQSNNADLQSILNTINAMFGGSEIESSSFVPTNSGGSTYKSKFSDNNIDLQRLLDMALALPDLPSYDPVFANNTWEQIIQACQNNEVPSTWVAGDQKKMLINGTEYGIDIIGKNHDTYSDGSGTAPLTFQMHECYTTTYPMNSSRTNVGGWKDSVMRTTTLPSLLQLMPTEVQTAIRAVDKRSSAGNKSTDIVVTSDKLFLLSAVEVHPKSTVESEDNHASSFAVSLDEGTQYEYYANGGTWVKSILGKTGTTFWALRSPNFADSVTFIIVENSTTYHISQG